MISARQFAPLLLAILLASPSAAQFQFDAGSGFDFADPLGGIGAEAEPDELVRLSARFAPAGEGVPAMVEVTAKVADGYHIFSTTQPKGGPQRTTLTIDASSGVRLVGPWVADPAPETHIDQEIWVGLPIEEHTGEVTWRAPVEIPEGADPASLRVTGAADMQACTEIACNNVEGTFTAQMVEPGAITAPAVATPVAEKPSPTNPTVPQTADASMGPPVASNSLLTILGFAFVGGLILNLMPCVLPVIGLKVLSFAEQAGHQRGRVLAMNLAYTAGLLSVFMLLAALAAFAGYGWGELFTHAEFKIGMVVLVFAMALSFLGVWEIPIPGFAGAGKANDLQAQEGYGGAFFKGVFTTVLATPCSGPFLGPVIGFTLTQPTWVTFLIFGAIGLGMASPYLLIGAFPSLVRWLPKPGAWMETFKQLMGFVLLGTVVFLMWSIEEGAYLPLLTTLVAVGFACWWIGRTPLTAPARWRSAAWIGGATTAVAIGLAAFTLAAPSKHELDWRPYSPAALASAQSRGAPVLVDFTADWCLTCKLNLKRAINTDRVREVVESNGVTPLLADWTDESDEIEAALAELGSRSIPLLAIYAPGATEPIILRDLISEDQLLEALAEAGAIEGNSEAAAAMPEIEIGDATPVSASLR